jgi:hypothetical protein
MASLNITPKEKALLEHYAYGIVAAAYASYQVDPHSSIKNLVIETLLGGLLAPILARVNPKSLVNTIVKETGAPAPLVETAVNTGIADLNKLVKDKTPKK